MNLPILIEIKNVKSLNVISVGTFSFEFDKETKIKSNSATLFNFGKLIGSVTFSANFGKR